MMEQLIDKVNEDGEIDVMIAPVGKFEGSNADGEAVPEDITKDNLDAIAEKVNQDQSEILVDVDHASVRPGLDRDTRAVGWISKLYTTIKGLFGKMRLTKLGEELIGNREYRFLSPVFSLDGNGHPIDIHSVATTNTPAFEGSIDPIVNHKAITNMENEKKEIVDEVKEEVVEAVKEADDEESETTEIKEEVKEEVAEAKPLTREDIVAIVREVLAEVKNAEPEKKEACNTCEEEKEEVIKLEALNSAGNKQVVLNASEGEAWRKLHGQEFFDYLRKNGIR